MLGPEHRREIRSEGTQSSVTSSEGVGELPGSDWIKVDRRIRLDLRPAGVHVVQPPRLDPDLLSALPEGPTRELDRPLRPDQQLPVDPEVRRRHGREPTRYDAQPDPAAELVLRPGQDQLGDSVERSPGAHQFLFVHASSLLV